MLGCQPEDNAGYIHGIPIVDVSGIIVCWSSTQAHTRHFTILANPKKHQLHLVVSQATVD